MFLKAKVHYQLCAEELVEQTLIRQQGKISSSGALVISTGEFTGRSPADKFIVKDAVTVNTVDWNRFNNPISEFQFLKLKAEVIAYLDTKKEVWIRNACACAYRACQLDLCIVTETPWSNHFAANMFASLAVTKNPAWTVIQAPGFKADPEIHGTRKSNFTVISFEHKTILIGGTGYTGEIKKGVFTVLNFILPVERKVLGMHCSANEGFNGDSALFFGLSGTGKTTLSSDPERRLIGDDEHGWDDDGIFNFEGGCYAKAINLTPEHEPEIYNAIRPGALVENVSFKPDSNEINFACSAVTENTRVSYPLHFIRNSKIPSVSGVPKNVFFLTCDAYGVLPPISKLTPDQARYYFISGYTAKIAGTEDGIKEPQVTFSACFGAPFLPLNPVVYAILLNDKLAKNQTTVWMVNTGWTGGAYGTGSRIALKYTRAMISAALSTELNNVNYKKDAFFGLDIPQHCTGVPDGLLQPKECWEDKLLYDVTAERLKRRFEDNVGSMLGQKYS